MIAQIDGDAGCFGVARYVGQGFLRDAKDFAFKRRSQGAIGATDGQIGVDLLGVGLFDETSEPRGERVGCGDGAKVPDASAGFGESFAYIGARAVDLLMGGGESAIETIIAR